MSRLRKRWIRTLFKTIAKDGLTLQEGIYKSGDYHLLFIDGNYLVVHLVTNVMFGGGRMHYTRFQLYWDESQGYYCPVREQQTTSWPIDKYRKGYVLFKSGEQIPTKLFEGYIVDETFAKQT